MGGRFKCIQLIGANFDVPNPNLVGYPDTDTGIRLMLSSLALYPSVIQIKHWAELARAANGAPVDALVWETDRAGERRPIGGIRITWEPQIKWEP